jgi:nucleotide-binding universal stress UspA family protein
MTGRIVVGVDRSPGARRALEWAVDEAKRRAATVEAVHAWEPPVVVSTPLGFAPVELTDEDLATEMAIVREAVADVDAEVEVTFAAGGAAKALMDAAKGADLLVVGTRGRGGFTGLLLGSVSQQVASHATVPVVVVPYR